jgi:hypothetical protein
MVAHGVDDVYGGQVVWRRKAIVGMVFMVV